MKRKWLWTAALLMAALLSSRAYAEAPEPVTVIEMVQPQATDERFFEFDSATGTVKGYSHEGPKDVIIPEIIGGVPVRVIGEYAFQAKGLTSVVLPEELEVIEVGAFLDNQLKTLSIPSGVREIGQDVFCRNQLTSVTFSVGLKKLGDGAFDTNFLTSIALPEGLTEIDNGAFKGNTLTSVQLPSTLEKIGALTFYQNELTSLLLPEGLKKMGESAFDQNQITELVIPSGLEMVPDGAFYGNPLKKLTIRPGVKRLERGAFQVADLTEVLVPKGCTWHEEAFDSETKVFVEYPKLQKSEAVLTVRFNKALKEVGAKDVALKLDGSDVEIQCTVEGDRLVIRPVGALEKGKVYRLYLYTTLQSTDGKELRYPVTMFFEYLG